MEGGSHAPPCSKLLDRAASEGSMKSPACRWSAVRTRPSTVKTNTCKDQNCSVCDRRGRGKGSGGAGGCRMFTMHRFDGNILKLPALTHAAYLGLQCV